MVHSQSSLKNKYQQENQQINQNHEHNKKVFDNIKII